MFKEFKTFVNQGNAIDLVLVARRSAQDIPRRHPAQDTKTDHEQ